MKLTRDEVFRAWAPAGGPWSDWAKPIAFAHLSRVLPPAPEPPPPDLSWVPPASQNVALVLDLPGAVGTWCAIALAEAHGYRPVPLYNAAPGPPPGDDGSPAWAGGVVHVWPVLRALAEGAPRLNALALAGGAPPAFVLDANRRGGAAEPRAGQFDNRSVSFTTDFPSGNLLAHRGIVRAVVVQETGAQPQADLSHALRLWQAAGVEVLLKALDAGGPPVPITLRPVSRWREMWDRLLVTVRLRRNPLGGFGGVVPEASGG